MKIILTGGGTAGHISPHIALYKDLSRHFDKIAYIGSSGGMEEGMIKENLHIPFFSVTVTKFDRGHLLSNFRIPYLLYKGIKDSEKILLEEKPDVIFSKGGYVSLPVVLAARKLRIPVVSHESDLSMGLANKLMKGSCKCICTTFEKTAKKVGRKGRFTGAPVREDMIKSKEESRKILGINTKKPVLLITGGSSGSRAINDCVRQSLHELMKYYYIIHLTGKNNFHKGFDCLRDYRQVEFTNDMPHFIGAADVVVTRAGSNTIFELALARKPMLLIPLPKKASRGDQILNAKYFRKQGLANMLLQEEMDTRTLVDEINQTYAFRKDYESRLENSGLERGNKKIVDEIVKVTVFK